MKPGIQKRLIGIRFGTNGPKDDPPSVPAALAAREEGGASDMREIGTLTSAVTSDRFGEAIGLGFVRLAWETPGTELFVGSDRRPARVSELPFV